VNLQATNIWESFRWNGRGTWTGTGQPKDGPSRDHEVVMFGTHLLKRTVQMGTIVAVLAAWLPSAHSKARRMSSCAASYKGAEELVKAGSLREAKATMLKCTATRCSGQIRKECARRVAEIESDIPTIVPLVQDVSGQPLTDVEVSMDGEVLTSKVDGRALMVDPGSRLFTFKSGGDVLANLRAVILQGQRNRTIEIALRNWGALPLVKTNIPASAPPPDRSMAQASLVDPQGRPEMNIVHEASGKHFTRGTYAMAALGALGLAGYGATTYLGNRDVKTLEACQPNCSASSVARVERMFLAGNISLGVGVAALAAGTYLYFTSDSPKAIEVAASQPSYRLAVQPTPAGGFASVSGSF
jgi:hypothetical protein